MLEEYETKSGGESNTAGVSLSSTDAIKDPVPPLDTEHNLIKDTPKTFLYRAVAVSFS